MISGELCAFCRHWMAGTIDLGTRAKAMDAGTKYICHIKQPHETAGSETCPEFADVFISPKEAGA